MRSADASNGAHGYFPGGVYIYEKTFTAPAQWEGKMILIEFEGEPCWRPGTITVCHG